MENTRKSRKVLAGLLAVALIFGSAPATLYNGGVLGGTAIVVSAEEAAQGDFVQLKSSTSEEHLADYLITPTNEQLSKFLDTLKDSTLYNYVVLSISAGGEYEVYDVRTKNTEIKDSQTLYDDVSAGFNAYYYFQKRDFTKLSTSTDVETLKSSIVTPSDEQITKFVNNMTQDQSRLYNFIIAGVTEDGKFIVRNVRDLSAEPETINSDALYEEASSGLNAYWYMTKHVHSFEYYREDDDENNTLRARCTGGCDIKDGLVMTITAENAVYDGQPHGAQLNDFNTTAFPGEYTILYNTLSRPTAGSEEIDHTKPPVEAGAYLAAVEVDGSHWINVPFVIEKAELALTPLDADYTGKPQALITGEIPAGTQFSLVEPGDDIVDEEKISDSLADDLYDKMEGLEGAELGYYGESSSALTMYATVLRNLMSAKDAETEEEAKRLLESAKESVTVMEEDLAAMKEKEAEVSKEFLAEAANEEGIKYINEYLKGKTLDDIKARFANTTEWTDKVPEATEVGEYPVWYKAKDPNHTRKTVKVIAKINKADTEVKVEDLKTDDTSKGLVKPVTVDGGTVKYAVGKDDKTAPADEEFSDKVPTADDDGTYFVWVKVFGDKNHKDSKPVCIKVVVGDEETTDEEYQLGDVDNNSRVDSRDIVKTAAHIKGIKALNDDEKLRADTDVNTKINSGDIVKMAAHIKGMKTLPKIKVKK